MKAKLLKKLRKQAKEVYVEVFLNDNGNACQVRLPYPNGRKCLKSKKGADAILYRRKWTLEDDFEYDFVPFESRYDWSEKGLWAEAYTTIDKNFVYENKKMIINCAILFLLHNHKAYRSSRKTKLVK